MKTAEEKRKMAENLREQAAYPGSSSMYMEAFIEDLRQIIDPYNMSNSYADLYGILADLIEPSEAEQWVASQGLTKEQLEFDWWLSGRVMHELGFDGDTADRNEVESRLLARLMPEGMEWLFEVWPKWSNGEYCKFGDWWKADKYGEYEPQQLRRLVFYTPEQLREWGQDDGDHFGYEWDFMRPSNPTDRPDKVEPPAPKVFDADGAEVHKGDEVWSTTGEFDGARTVRSVISDDDDSPPYAMFEERREPWSCLCCCLTHERPDSWERLEEDARQLDIDLNDTTDDYPRMSCCRDLVRRAKALAERGRECGDGD